jgi:S1-C subfamily serine protease
MKPVPLLLTLLCVVSLPGKDPIEPADRKVVVLEPLVIREKPIISYAIDITVYADPATKKVSRIFIARVLPGTDAEKAGLQAGDEIVSLGGTPVKELDARVAPDSALGRLFLNREPGEALDLEVVTHRTQKFTLRAQRGTPWERP